MFPDTYNEIEIPIKLIAPKAKDTFDGKPYMFTQEEMTEVCKEAEIILTGDVPPFATLADNLLVLQPGPEKYFHTYIFTIEQKAN